MNEKIRAYVAELFEDAPKTQRARDLQDEVYANLLDKYEDLKAEGVPEETILDELKDSIGDVTELIGALRGEQMVPENRSARQRHALLIALAVMLYILSIVPVLIFQDEIGVVGMFAMAAVATGLLIFNGMTKPRYQKTKDTVVEDFKEFTDQKERKDKSLYNAISGGFWMIVVCVYFLLSFITGGWYITWLVFLIGMAIQQVIRIIMMMRDR